MVARVTLAEVDVVRHSLADAVGLFRTSVIPALQDQDGYEGSYVLTTAEGKALVLTFWASEEAAEAGITSGHYAEQVAKFVTVYSTSPGRELYDVAIQDLPVASG